MPLKKSNEDYNPNKKRNIDLGQTFDVSNSSLKKVVRGTVIVIIGTIVAMPLAFLAKVILARFFTQSEYGIFSLGFTIINILVVISILGLGIGSTRQIAYYRVKKKFLKVKGIIISSILISFFSSLILSITVILTSDFISTKIFHDSALSMPLKIFAISIPFITIINVLISIYRGFDRVEEKVYFQDLLRNILFSLFLLPVIFFAFSFHYAIIAFSTSFIATLIVFVIYTKKRFPLTILGKSRIRPIASIYKETLLFSLPLLSIGLFQMIISWTDTLMLGGIRTLDEVGLYNAAHPIAGFIGVSMGALLIIYVPVLTGLFAKESFPEIRRIYSILTKWIFLTSLPLFLIIFLFPQVFLNSLFGSDYISAIRALQVLSLGVLIVNLLGPNGTTLVAIGKTRFLMWAIIAAAGINIILNFILIPTIGILGASIATSFSIIFHCTIRKVKVHSVLKIDIMNRNFLKPTIISVSLIIIIWFLLKTYIVVTLWMIPLIFILFIFVIFFVVLITKSLDQEDIMMLLIIEKKIGINLSLIKKILSRFI